MSSYNIKKDITSTALSMFQTKEAKLSDIDIAKIFPIFSIFAGGVINYSLRWDAPGCRDIKEGYIT